MTANGGVTGRQRGARAPWRTPAMLLLALAALGAGIAFGVRFARDGERERAVQQAAIVAPAAAQSGSQQGTQATTEAVPQGHVYCGVTGEPDDVNPFTTASAPARRYVLAFTHDTLLDSDPMTGEPRPALAERWEVAPDGLSFTVDLRPGVVFSDGSPLRLEDVLFTWEVARTPGIVLGSLGEGMDKIVDVEAIGPMRLRIRLRDVHFAAVRSVAESWVVASAKWFTERVAALARAEGRTEAPQLGDPAFADFLMRIREETGPGTGPYSLGVDAEGNSTWRKHRDLLLVRNDKSWRRAARPGTWNFAAIRLRLDGTAALTHLALLARELDWYFGPDVETILAREPSLHDDYRKVTFDSRNFGVLWCEWNCRRKELADPRVRRALGMLFDRQAIVDRMFGGAGRPAVAFGKVDAAEYPRELAPLPYDLEAARTLLREAGYGPGAAPLELSLFGPAGNDMFRRVLELAADAGRKVGIAIAVQTLESGALKPLLEAGQWDGCVRMWEFRPWVDPYDWLHGRGAFNVGGFTDPETDELLERARTTIDDRARAELLARFHRRIHELQPAAFLVHPLFTGLFNAHIRNGEPGPLGLFPERFWVPPEKQRRG